MKLALTILALAFASSASAIPVTDNGVAKGHDKNDHSQAYHKFVNAAGDLDVVKTFGTDNGKGHDFDHSHRDHITTVPEPSSSWTMLAGLGLVGFMVSRLRP